MALAEGSQGRFSLASFYHMAILEPMAVAWGWGTNGGLRLADLNHVPTVRSCLCPDSIALWIVAVSSVWSQREKTHGTQRGRTS